DGEVAGRFKTGVNPDDPKVIAVIEAELAKKSAIKAGRDRKVPPAKKNYQGRRVAFTMHWLAADWLTRTAREREEATSVMIKQLKLKPGNVVADIGCGNGYHTLMMAKLVGETGKVYGVDIQPQMLVFLKRRAQKAGLKNVKPIIGTWINPNLPDGEVDLVMMCDAYHEFSHPVEMLKNIRKSLSPKGRVLLVEFRAEDPNVPIKPDHKMSKKQIMKEMTANGFKLAESFDELPWQHMMFFEKAK
ncbi:MAG: class I SAM-dependent methyltransferase, partial [Pirellulaceae bacterium]|nr:class I SAM-dependent methyltransferase [Pirellulaceae bacterium]